jgi:Reverse transcriptase (RNA-dependent DNA polymerase)
VFELCIISRFFVTSDNHFGFKKLFVVHMQYIIPGVRSIINYIKCGSTVDLCAVHISKAFDRMNHHGLYTKFMHGSLPYKLLSVFENRYDKGFACVKWNSAFSSIFSMFKSSCGGVLSPSFSAAYIDDIVCKVISDETGSYVGLVCVSILLYANDILLLAPSLSSLQELLFIC